MTSDEEIHNALLAIYSRLNTIEGKVTLVARADRERILQVMEEVLRQRPLVGQIYLLLDGTRTQREVHEELAKYSITPSQPTVSRRMDDMSKEYGIADLVKGGAVKVFRKNREMEDVLNLSKRIVEWLEEEGEVVPKQPQRRRRRKTPT
jgi:hypothetical protein